tara:strand:- start:1683 stop:2576 length:894 start_codon:yes stop_codon:yes gene_type:complete
MFNLFRFTGHQLNRAATRANAIIQARNTGKLTAIGVNLMQRSAGVIRKDNCRYITTHKTNKRINQLTFIINQAKKIGCFSNNLQTQLERMSDNLLERCFQEMKLNKNKPYAQQDTIELVNMKRFQDLIVFEPLVVTAAEEAAKLIPKKNKEVKFQLNSDGSPRFNTLTELEKFICIQYLKSLKMTKSAELLKAHNSERFRSAINKLYTLVKAVRSYGEMIENPLFLRHFQESLQHQLNVIDDQSFYNDWILRAAELYVNKKNALIHLMNPKYLKDKENVKDLKDIIRRLDQVGNLKK